MDTRTDWAPETVPTLRWDARIMDMRATAAAFVSRHPNAPVLRCSWCAEECDTYSAAHDDTEMAILRFFEHCAFDHAGRARFDIVTVAARVVWEG